MTAREVETSGGGGGEHDLRHGHYTSARWHGVDMTHAWATCGGGAVVLGRGCIGKGGMMAREDTMATLWLASEITGGGLWMRG